MGLLTKLKSLLGLEDDRSQVRRGESGVTIERDPDESAQPDVETESAVKGVDAGGEESTSDAATDAGKSATGTESAGTTEPAGSETTEDATDGSAAPPEGIEEAEPEADESAPDESEADAPAAEADDDVTEVEDTETADEAETTDAESAETEDDTEEVAAEESESAGEPLEDVKGIGPAYAERLRSAGVADVAELATADADRLAEETDLSEKRISRWIEQAQAR
ncbi:helix-hairpin-helix domain-containing protein [Halorussus litoreus]|uniref:helix-hairpin-helix domain-containing protein n=1 Tax=Halorussus litoreus TaxID=1710536 RepID=UPI000E2260E8|nr:helix-hairpin-helix domain-containing protein [Halorussus litoreus]